MEVKEERGNKWMDIEENNWKERKEQMEGDRERPDYREIKEGEGNKGIETLEVGREEKGEGKNEGNISW